MEEKHIGGVESKEIFYEGLEGFAREKIRGHSQDLLEQEISEWLGRAKSERKVNVLEQPGYRNGYGKPRRFTMSLGTVRIQRPRVRDLGERFKSKALPMFKRQLKSRGVRSARLFVGDGNLGLSAAVGEVYPQAEQQLCWNHKMQGVIDAVSKKEQTEVKKHLNAMMYADSREQALKERKKFAHGFSHNPKAVRTGVGTGSG